MLDSEFESMLAHSELSQEIILDSSGLKPTLLTALTLGDLGVLAVHFLEVADAL